MKRWIVLIIVVVLLGAGFLLYRRSSEGQRKPVFRTTQVERGTISKVVSGTGNIEHRASYELASQSGGVLNKLSLKKKDSLKTGQEIFRVNDEPVFILNGGVPLYRVLKSGQEGDDVKTLQLSLKEMGYDIDQTDGEFGSDTYNELLQFQEDRDLPENGRADPKMFQVFPLPLEVVEVKAEQGDRVSAGTVIATMATAGKFRAKVLMNEIDVPLLKLGDKAKITVDALPGEEFTGKVSSISEVAATSGQSTQSTQNSSSSSGVVNYEVEIELDAVSEKVKPGMTVNADIIIEEKPNVLMVPSEAVLDRGGRKAVRVLEGEESVRMVPVETGISSDNDTEITGGELEEGDAVILGAINLDNVDLPARPRGGFGFGPPGQGQQRGASRQSSGGSGPPGGGGPFGGPR